MSGAIPRFAGSVRSAPSIPTTKVKLIGPLFDGRLFRNIVTEEIGAVEEAGQIVIKNAKRFAPTSGKEKAPGIKSLKQSLRFLSGTRKKTTKQRASFFPVRNERAGKADQVVAQFYSVWYTHFPERGTKYQRPQYFLRRAMNTSKPIVLKLMTRGLSRGIRKSIVKEAGGV